MRITLKVDEARQTIDDVKFMTFGCAAAIACGSLLTQLIKGRTLPQALQVTSQDVVDGLGGLPEEKLYCSLLAQQAALAAIYDYYGKHPQKQIPYSGTLLAAAVIAINTSSRSSHRGA